MSHFRCQNLNETLKRADCTFISIELAKAAWKLTYSQSGKLVSFKEGRRGIIAAEVYCDGIFVGKILETYESSNGKIYVDHL